MQQSIRLGKRGNMTVAARICRYFRRRPRSTVVDLHLALADIPENSISTVLCRMHKAGTVVSDGYVVMPSGRRYLCYRLPTKSEASASERTHNPLVEVCRVFGLCPL